MVFDNLVDDGKADAAARFAGRFRPPGPVEAGEDLFQLLRIHTHALILYRETQQARIRPARHGHQQQSAKVLRAAAVVLARYGGDPRLDDRIDDLFTERA